MGWTWPPFLNWTITYLTRCWWTARRGFRGRPSRPGRSFVGNVFATTPDLVRFAEALRAATVLNRPYADLYTDRVGVVLSNYDDLPEFREILGREEQAITGQR
ncbi:hypothetical protein [Spirillospora sp. NPDC047279]|uniref:hypothetical protein n=1 Tax=Spirillospora sp. NPDC047279 TaxID=3155478 RepID=UPI0033C57D18